MSSLSRAALHNHVKVGDKLQIEITMDTMKFGTIMLMNEQGDGCIALGFDVISHTPGPLKLEIGCEVEHRIAGVKGGVVIAIDTDPNGDRHNDIWVRWPHGRNQANRANLTVTKAAPKP